MADLFKYRYYCSTEEAFIYEWREDSDPVPVLCKNDSGHPIQDIVIVQKKKDIKTIIGHTESDLDFYADRLILSAMNGENKFGSYKFENDFHLQKIFMQWDGCAAGDYCLFSINNLAGDCLLDASANQSDQQVYVQPGFGQYYDPSNGAKYIEFWSMQGSEKNTLLEVREITSVTVDTVFFTPGLSGNRDTSVKASPRIRSYSPVRGDDGTDGGVGLKDSGSDECGSDYLISGVIPAGLSLCVVFFTQALPLTERNLTINIKMRKPAE